MPTTPTASSTGATAVASTVAEAYQDHGGRILAALIRSVGDFTIAEDALQDALAEAVERWPVRGIPDNPPAWLMTTARRRSIDRIRRAANLRDKQAAIAYLASQERPQGQPDELEPEIPDERLRLIFTCCHPALPLESQIALTLRTIAGMTTEQIATAFLVPAPTMGQRITRAKRKIKDAAIPYVIPEGDQLPGRLSAVLAVIYLIFNEGYSRASPGDATETDLSEEALKLAEMLATLLPDETEATGLFALLLLLDARRRARQSPDGTTVLLKDQDRALWDQAKISEGIELLTGALKRGSAGVYQIQAAIAAIHSESPSIEETDWPQIALLYDRLYDLNRSPVIRLNHAVAVAEAWGPEAGLQMLDELESAVQLNGYAPYFVARSELLLRLERRPEALEALLAAQRAASTELDQANIARRLREFPEPFS